MKTLFRLIIFPALILVLTVQLSCASDFSELENKANRGDLEAMYKLGEMYENGVGKIQNYVEAHKWYNIASSRGYIKARNARNALAEKMIAEQLAEAQKLAIKWKPSLAQESEVDTETKDKKQLLLQELFKAISDSDLDKVKALLDSGADVNMKAADGSTALMAATLKRHDSLVKFLLGKGADVSARNNNGDTAHNIARKKRYDEIAGLLTINLRSSYRDLGYGQVKAALKECNFFDQHRNATGDFINDYELKIVRGDTVVKDNATGLLWHQSGSEKNMKWNEAKEWIRDLNANGYAGYQDWRLPTVEEAASLLEPNQNDDYLYVAPLFNSEQRLIWTGDSFGSRGAWEVNFVTGGVIWRFTLSNLYVRPVRSFK